jgi:hypothetical protein
VVVEIDDAVVGMLRATGWLVEETNIPDGNISRDDRKKGARKIPNENLPPTLADDRKKIGLALSAMLADAAKR